MKFLDLTGVSTLWGKVKQHVNTRITEDVLNKKGTANGFASLDANSKLLTSQLPTLKTINGNTIVGSGNITLDLSIYTIVTELPATGADNKIYLVLTPGGGTTGDLYTEYAYINNKWEQFGKYKAEVDLTPYVKTAELDTKVSGLGYVKGTAIPAATASQTGGIKIGYTETAKNYAVKLDNGKAYVTVPWSNTTYNTVTTTANGLMIAADKVKLDGIAAGATADSAITTAELEAALV